MISRSCGHPAQPHVDLQTQHDSAGSWGGPWGGVVHYVVGLSTYWL